MTHIDIILKEMFSRVGVKKVDTTEPDWFLQNSWTPEEERHFVNWMTDYLIEHKDARQEIMRFPLKNKSEIKKFAQQFALNYGWKYTS